MASVHMFRTIVFRSVQCIATSKVPVRTIKRWVSPTLRELKRRQKELGPQPPQIRSSFLEWNYEAEWYAFGKRVKEEFNEDLLRRAFTDRSYITKQVKQQMEAGIENPEISLVDNSELIEEGEKFMYSYVKKYLCLLLPKFPEEGIRALHKHLLTDDLLAHICLNIGARHLVLSSDEPPEQETYALTFKALVGALLRSSGPERTGLFVRDFVLTELVSKDVNEIWQPDDLLSAVNNILLKEGCGVAEPRLIGELGKNTVLAVFRVGIYSDKIYIGSGYGETIPTAINMALLDVLKRFFRTRENMAPFSFELNPYDDSFTSQNVPLSEWTLDAHY